MLILSISEKIAVWKDQGFFIGRSAVMMRKILCDSPQNRHPSNVSDDGQLHKKRARLSSAHSDLLHDLDELDGADEGEDAVEKSIKPDGNFSAWISSDEVDFGDPDEAAVILKAEAQQQQQQQQHHRGTSVGLGIESCSVSDAAPLSRGALGAEEEEDGDNEVEDEGQASGVSDSESDQDNA